MIDHPAHYNIPGKKECIEQMLEDYGPVVTGLFCLTNAYKYEYRIGKKDDEKQELGKIEWYLNYYNNLDFMVKDNCQLNLSCYDDIIKLKQDVEQKLRKIKEEKNETKG